MNTNIAIHGAMNNFDNGKGIQFGIGSSHGTILMLFENAYDSVEDHYLEISKLMRHPLEHCQN